MLALSLDEHFSEIMMNLEGALLGNNDEYIVGLNVVSNVGSDFVGSVTG